jgi:hypothetical protein
LRSYFQQKYSWSNNTLDSIWWKPYYNSLSKLSFPEKVIIFKFINNKLPTNSRENKYYSFRGKHCTQCQCDKEDEDHILQCFSIKRQNARKYWLNAIASYLSQNHTPVGMKHIILQNLNQFLEPSQITDHEIDFDISAFDKANQQQNIIGWQHFIRGRLSFEWGKAISSQLSTDQFHHMSAEKWAADLLYINWQYILRIWRE